MEHLTGPARRGAETRQAIIQAAASVFSRRGFRRTDLAQVAARVGKTPANILYHFGSKEGLLLAVIQDRDLRASELAADLLPSGGLASLTGLIRFAEMSEAEPGLVALHTVLQIENLDPSDPVYEYFQARITYVQAWVKQTIEAAQAAGEVRADVDAAVKAREVVAYLEGAAVLWVVNPELSLVELYRSYLDTTVRAIATRRGERTYRQAHHRPPALPSRQAAGAGKATATAG